MLAEDRAEKLELIKKAYQRLKNAEAMPAEKYSGGEDLKKKTVLSLRNYLDYLKVQADINDPAVQRRFEDGFGTFHTPAVFTWLARILTWIYGSQAT